MMGPDTVKQLSDTEKMVMCTVLYMRSVHTVQCVLCRTCDVSADY